MTDGAVDLDGLAGRGEMARPLQDEEVATGDPGELPAPFDVLADVELAVDGEGGEVQRSAHVLYGLAIGETDLESFLADVVKDVPGLQRTETMIVLSSSKETTKVEPPPAG